MNEWQQQAQCIGIDPDLFFPNLGEHQKIVKAKEICNQCDVILECRQYSIELASRYDTPGIYGGWTQKVRNAHMRKNNISVRRPGTAYDEVTA